MYACVFFKSARAKNPQKPFDIIDRDRLFEQRET